MAKNLRFYCTCFEGKSAPTKRKNLFHIYCYSRSIEITCSNCGKVYVLWKKDLDNPEELIEVKE